MEGALSLKGPDSHTSHLHEEPKRQGLLPTSRSKAGHTEGNACGFAWRLSLHGWRLPQRVLGHAEARQWDARVPALLLTPQLSPLLKQVFKGLLHPTEAIHRKESGWCSLPRRSSENGFPPWLGGCLVEPRTLPLAPQAPGSAAGAPEHLCQLWCGGPTASSTTSLVRSSLFLPGAPATSPTPGTWRRPCGSTCPESG